MLRSADIMLAVLAAINMHLIVPLRCNDIVFALSMCWVAKQALPFRFLVVTGQTDAAKSYRIYGPVITSFSFRVLKRVRVARYSDVCACTVPISEHEFHRPSISECAVNIHREIPTLCQLSSAFFRFRSVRILCMRA